MASSDELAVSYGFFDRLVHRLAFRSPIIRSTAMDVENAMFRSKFESIEPMPPVFITSLPRAGTTLLLEVLHRFPSVATHTYRDMPFVLSPVLWARLTGSFHKRGELRERAHGDGMAISYDSPEAFEEILWRELWPGKYGPDEIALWTADDVKGEATRLFLDHMRKIVALRCPEYRCNARYVSKNNANIARLDLVGKMFPGATILVPFRDPIQQAASLLRQHRKFTDVHGRTAFAKEYMADVGHYEFGAVHKPIAFPGFDRSADTFSIDYWLAYWVAAFEYVLQRRERIVLVSYESLCAAGRSAIARICERTGIADEGELESAAESIKEAPPPRQDGYSPAPALLERATSVHARLLEAQILA